MRLGTVTYNLAKDWDIPTLIKNCEAAGFEAVELRTTHKHGVEITSGKDAREKVRDTFNASKVKLVSFGTTCEYHAADPAVVEKNIEETKQWVVLAHDVGALGIKVRPNGFPPGVAEAQTLKQIGAALRRCGEYAQGYGIEIWVEVHGRGTQLPANMRAIMDHCQHPMVGVCWNSNPPDVVNGSVKQSFELLRPFIKSVHINELWTGYPWRELFTLLRGINYDRYTLAEVPESREPERFMRYYRALWRELSRA